MFFLSIKKLSFYFDFESVTPLYCARWLQHNEGRVKSEDLPLRGMWSTDCGDLAIVWESLQGAHGAGNQ